MEFIETLEKCLGKALGRGVVFDKVFEPLKPGDVPATYASTDLLFEAVGFKPHTPLEEGLKRFADWYVGIMGTFIFNNYIKKDLTKETKVYEYEPLYTITDFTHVLLKSLVFVHIIRLFLHRI
jgi:hypothetical protein